MKYLELLVSSLNPYGVYQSSQNIATNVFIFITPFLLVIAVASRILETELDTMSALGKWERAVRDFVCFGFLIVCYFFIMTLANKFMNAVYLIINDIGDYQTLSEQLQTLLDEGLGIKQSEWKWFKKAKRADASPLGLLMIFLYWVSNLFVVTTYVFLRIAHAITYSFAFIMGLILIPMAISTKFNFLKGWGIILGTAFLWPIIESVFLGFASDIFISSIKDILAEQTLLMKHEDKAGLRAFFATINVVLGMIMITAPLIAGAILAGANAMFPMIAPFATGAISVASTALATGRAVMPGGAIMGGAAATAGMLGLKSVHSGASPAGGGSSYSGSAAAEAYGLGPTKKRSGDSGGASGYGGGPRPRHGGGSSGSSTTSGRSSNAGGGSSSTTSSGMHNAEEESGPAPRNQESNDSEQQAREKKRRKARTGHFVHQARNNKNKT